MEIFLGVVVSLVIQIVKKSLKLGEYETLAVLVSLCMVAAVIYASLTAFGVWDAVYNVLVTAGAFYAFVIQRFPSVSPEKQV